MNTCNLEGFLFLFLFPTDLFLPPPFFLQFPCSFVSGVNSCPCCKVFYWLFWVSQLVTTMHYSVLSVMLFISGDISLRNLDFKIRSFCLPLWDSTTGVYSIAHAPLNDVRSMLWNTMQHCLHRLQRNRVSLILIKILTQRFGFSLSHYFPRFPKEYNPHAAYYF